MQQSNLTAQLTAFVDSLEKQKLSATSIKNYKNDINHFIIYIGDNSVDSENVREYLQLLEERYPSIATYNRKVTSIKKFVKYLFDNQIISSPLTDNLEHKSSLLNNYRNYMISHNKNKKTVKNYVADVNKFLKWLNVNDIDTEKISVDTIYLYKGYLSMHLKESSVRRHIASLKSFYEYLDENTNRVTPSTPLAQNANRYAFLAIIAILLISFTQNTSVEVYKDEISPNINTMNKLSRTYSLSSPLYFKPVKISISLEDGVNNRIPQANSFEIVKPALAADSYTAVAEQNSISNGKSMIKKGSLSKIIYSDTINSNSIIHITPTSNTHNQILFIEKQAKGYFKVMINNPQEIDITFNWSVKNDSF